MPGTRSTIFIFVGIATLILVIFQTLNAPLPASLLPPLLIFCALNVFTLTFGIPIAEGVVSMQTTTAVAAYLVMGPTGAAWTVFTGALVHGVIRARPTPRPDVPHARNRTTIFHLTIANAAMHTVTVLFSGAAFRAAGGITPLEDVAPYNYIPLALLCLTYLVTNYAIASVVIGLRGREAMRRYLNGLPRLVLYDAAPLSFAPLMALIYLRLGIGLFLIFILTLVLSSLAMQELATASLRLQRRVQELDSLHAIGQALSASLDLDTILAEIHIQARALMSTDNFYVALYNEEENEVSFPLAIVEGQPRRWSARQAGDGLTEYVLRTGAPLLIQENVSARVKELGVAEVGRQAVSWLGVPILAGDAPLGVIAVQSYAYPETYDESHLEMLTTLASHAAVAIQNARLYTRTDAALTRRVQELDSILRTVREGILLLDHEGHVLAANRTLTAFLGLTQAGLSGRRVDEPVYDEGDSLLARIGYTPASFQAHCRALSHGEVDFEKLQIVVRGPAGDRHVERTLVPVRDRDEQITRWLITLRDVTEEVELTMMREDLTDMLIHDLRAPLAIVQTGIEMVGLCVTEGDTENIDKALKLTWQSSDKMLHMIDTLLDISRLESGNVPLHRETIPVDILLRDITARFQVQVGARAITLSVDIAPDLPPVYVDVDFLARTIGNLLDNAAKFTPDGGRIWLRAAIDADFDPQAVLVSVIDAGQGIPSEVLPHIFKKFHQGKSQAGQSKGFGVGLSFCKLVAEAHGGRIWVESEVGRGSTFTIALPAASV
ncbi:MAG: GAF domain-containing protein [Anaerolineae bacterium]|nr:GAF domain-containing protein [Anaerolineae bacterium]